MKKNMKKLISMALAATMALSLMVPAWAENQSVNAPHILNLIQQKDVGMAITSIVEHETSQQDYDIIIVDKEIAEQMGENILHYIDANTMVFFAGMNNAEVETYSTAPRWSVAAKGDTVIGSGLTLTNGTYHYITYHGEFDTNSINEADDGSVSRKCEDYATTMYRFLQTDVTIGNTLDLQSGRDVSISNGNWDQCYTAIGDVKNDGLVWGQHGYTCYEVNYGLKNVNGNSVPTYSILCDAKYVPKSDIYCKDIALKIETVQTQNIINASVMPSTSGNGTIQASLPFGLSWSYDIGNYTIVENATLSQQTQTWRIKPTSAVKGKMWQIVQGVDIASKISVDSRGQVRITVSTPTSQSNILSDVYNFPIA